MDMAVLVSGQGEALDRIENHVNLAVENTEAGVGALVKANKLQVRHTHYYIFWGEKERERKGKESRHVTHTFHLSKL